MTFATLTEHIVQPASFCGRLIAKQVNCNENEVVFLLLSIIPKGGNGKTGGRPFFLGGAMWQGGKKPLTKANSS